MKTTIVGAGISDRTELSMTLQEPESWRDLLAMLTSDPKERMRVSQVTGIGEMTLKRWANHATDPQPHTLRPLLIAFPKYRDLFIRLIQKEFKYFTPSDQPDFRTGEAGDEAKHVPLSLYEEAHAIREKAPTPLLLWSIGNLVLKEALEQFDPHMEGVGIWILQCIAYPDHTGTKSIHCLRERFQTGTTPWSYDSTPALFLGSESLSGYATSCGRAQVCQDLLENPNFLPIRIEPYEKSSAAYPLMQSDRIAGCLVISSTQTGYFNEDRLKLLQRYAHLVCLGFQDSEFLPKANVSLQEMPDSSIQKEHFTSFRPRVSTLLSGSEINLTQAEEQVWMEMAQELCGKKEHRT